MSCDNFYYHHVNMNTFTYNKFNFQLTLKLLLENINSKISQENFTNSDGSELIYNYIKYRYFNKYVFDLINNIIKYHKLFSIEIEQEKKYFIYKYIINKHHNLFISHFISNKLIDNDLIKSIILSNTLYSKNNFLDVLEHYFNNTLITNDNYDLMKTYAIKIIKNNDSINGIILQFNKFKIFPNKKIIYYMFKRKIITTYNDFKLLTLYIFNYNCNNFINPNIIQPFYHDIIIKFLNLISSQEEKNNYLYDFKNNFIDPFFSDINKKINNTNYLYIYYIFNIQLYKCLINLIPDLKINLEFIFNNINYIPLFNDNEFFFKKNSLSMLDNVNICNININNVCNSKANKIGYYFIYKFYDEIPQNEIISQLILDYDNNLLLNNKYINFLYKKLFMQKQPDIISKILDTIFNYKYIQKEHIYININKWISKSDLLNLYNFNDYIQNKYNFIIYNNKIIIDKYPIIDKRLYILLNIYINNIKYISLKDNSLFTLINIPIEINKNISQDICSNCYRSVSNITFIECKHSNLCYNCFMSLLHCHNRLKCIQCNKDIAITTVYSNLLLTKLGIIL